jgi:hypothetical protein
VNLHGVPLEPHHLIDLIQHVPWLVSLDVTGCRKLTPAATAAMRSAACCGRGAGARPLARLQQLHMQRCFQLTAECLTDVLSLAAGPCSDLACVSMSHMALEGWPACAGADPTPAPASPLRSATGPAFSDSASGQDTASDGGSSLAAAPAAADPAAATTHEQALTAAAAALGNATTLAPPTPQPACMAAAATNLQLLVLTNCSGLHAGGLLALAAACPQLEALFLGGSILAVAADGSPALPACAAAAAAALAFPEELSSAALADHLMADHEHLRRAGDGGGGAKPTLAMLLQGVPGALAGARARAALLAALTLQLPRLRVLELTFHGPQVQAWLGVAFGGAAWAAATVGAARPPPAVWDFCRPTRLAEAERLLAAAAAAAGGGMMAAAVRCAVNCSARARTTPLHLAAYRGSPACVQGALALGALHSARDTAGAEPLFLAAEGGWAAAAEQLLVAGADPRVRNTAGETPLYIAGAWGCVGGCKMRICRAC